MPIVEQRSEGNGKDLALACGVAAAVVIVLLGLMMGGLFSFRATSRPAVRPGGSGSSGWTSAPGLSIPDHSPGGATLAMPAPAGSPQARVSGIRLTLTLEHPRPQDLQVTLRHPDGTRVVLRKPGTVGELYTTYTGTVMQPFTGRPAPGDWKLLVADLRQGKSGKVREVDLNVDYAW